MPWSKEYVEHLRAVHFTLIVVAILYVGYYRFDFGSPQSPVVPVFFTIFGVGMKSASETAFFASHGLRTSARYFCVAARFLWRVASAKRVQACWQEQAHEPRKPQPHPRKVSPMSLLLDFGNGKLQGHGSLQFGSARAELTLRRQESTALFRKLLCLYEKGSTV